MKLRHLFVIAALLQLAAIGLLAVSPGLSAGVKTAVRVIAVADIAFLIYFYRRTMRPLHRLVHGLDMLRGQDWNSTLRHVGQPDVDAISDVFNDMISRLKDQRIRFQERTHLLNLLVESAPVGVMILGLDGAAPLTNPAARAMLGASASLAPFLGGMESGDTADMSTPTGATLRCSCRSFIDRGIRRRFYLMEDISNSVAAAERAAYEKVIRVISHEVNNTVAGLTSAIGSIVPLLAEARESDMASLLESCADRATALSAFIRRFADVVRLPEAVLTPRPLNALIARCMPFLESLGAPLGIPVVFEPGTGVPDVQADAAMMEQALINIVKNAVESISQSATPGGRVTITTLERDGRATALITDNGPGISDEKSRMLFTPFFTDKPMGQGVGLMLVRDILRRHDATFSLATAPDGLTTFTISLPPAERIGNILKKH